jgi:hypothetical protein
MKSLSQLNSFAAQNLELTDLRYAKVNFDRTVSQDKVITISSTSVTVPNGIEIVEVVNYSTADVRYVVTIKNSLINPITSSLAFGSLPSGVSVTESPTGTYTVSGIKSVSDWNAIKNPVWTLPSDYATYPLFYIEARVVYFDEEADEDYNQTCDIYDTRFYPITFAEAVATMTSVGVKTVSARAAIAVTGSILSLDQNLVRTGANITATATVFLETFPIKGYEASLSAQTTTSIATVNSRRRNTSASLAVTSTLSGFLSEVVRPINRIDFTAQFGPIGPGGIPYLEGNGFPYATGLGYWPQGFPGILRIKPLAANVSAESSLTAVAIEPILAYANFESSFAQTAEATKFKGVVNENFTASSQLTAESDPIVSTTVALASSTSVSCNAVKTASNVSAITAVGSFAAGPFSIVPGIRITVNRFPSTSVGVILSGTVNVEIIWGDGTSTTATSAGTYSRDYGSTSGNTSASTPIIIRGTLTGFNGVTSGSRILQCRSFGTVGLTNVSGMFASDGYQSQYPLGQIPQSIPSTITNVSNLFKNRAGTWPELLTNGAWNTANITNMEGMFDNARTFTGFRSANPSVDNIGYWETGNVTNMNNMFNNAQAMNTDISTWCVSLIPTKPTGFDTGTSSGWTTAEKPIWGTCP